MALRRQQPVNLTPSDPGGSDPTSTELTQIEGSVEWEFTDNSVGGTPTEWLWDFGDGATSTEQNPIHTYTESGQYTVTMTASNEFGSSDISQLVEIVLDFSGCTDPAYQEYSQTATVDDGSCLTLIVPGCTDPAYYEYSQSATVDDGSCLTYIGDMNPNWDFLNDMIPGCMDPAYVEYNPEATVTVNELCITLKELRVTGCTDSRYEEHNPAATEDDGSCKTLIIKGCTDGRFEEYNPKATLNDGSCKTRIEGPILGCMNPEFEEYNPAATEDDGSCLTIRRQVRRRRE